jgi:arylsulfatase A-like enzyme
MSTILIDIDSLRADHVGAYGYDAPTTPNIDSLAEDGIRFTRAYAASSPCMPSRAAVLSGRFGIHNGVVTHGPRGQTLAEPQSSHDWTEPARRYWTLPEVFFENRVRTGAVSSFPRHPAYWFYHVWHEFYQPQEPKERPENVPHESPPPSGLPGEGFQTPRADEVADIATRFIEANSDQEFLLYTQFWDPHEPYNRTEAEIDEFRGATPLPEYPTAEQITEHQSWDIVRGAADMNIASQDNLQELLARYDAEISFVDEHVGRILQALRRAGVYEESTIILTADHGEEFGEHGSYRHHWSTHDGTQRVPLIVKPPRDAAGSISVCDELVVNVDLAPTATDFADLPTPAGWQGRSLRPLLSESADSWRDHIVFDHGLYVAQRAVRTERWK